MRDGVPAHKVKVRRAQLVLFLFLGPASRAASHGRLGLCSPAGPAERVLRTVEGSFRRCLRLALLPHN